MAVLIGDRAYVTWTDDDSDREDPGYYLPSTLDIERKLRDAGALPLSDVARMAVRPWRPAASGFFRYVDISAVDHRTGLVTPASVAVEDAPSRARQLLRAGDIVVSSVRPERGAVARIEREHDGAVASTGFFVLELQPQLRHIRDALFVYLLSDVYRLQAVRRASSSMYPVIGPDEFETILVPVEVLEGCTAVSASLAESEAAFRRAADHLNAARDALSNALSRFVKEDPTRPLSKRTRYRHQVDRVDSG